MSSNCKAIYPSFGSLTIEITSPKTISFELGIFFIISSILTFSILSKINGNFSRIEYFFGSKSWPFLKKSSHLIKNYTLILTIILTTIMSFSLISLFTWGGTISINNSSAGISIILLGLTLYLLIIGGLYIKWSNFTLTKFSMFCLLIAFFLMFSFKLTAILKSKGKSFFGVSAVFLTFNAFFLLIIIFLSFSFSSASFEEIFFYIKNHQILNLTKNSLKGDFPTSEELIQAERLDNNYQPSSEEIIELSSFLKEQNNQINNNKLFSNTILGDGIIFKYIKKSPKWKKYLILLIIYIISLGILAGYSYTVYAIYHCTKNDNKERLGVLTSIAAITTDIILYFFSQQYFLKYGPLEISFLMIIIRIFLYAFGGDKWFIGYCFLYIVLCSFLSYHIIDKKFPLYQDIILKKIDFIDITKTPEFVAFLA